MLRNDEVVVDWLMEDGKLQEYYGRVLDVQAGWISVDCYEEKRLSGSPYWYRLGWVRPAYYRIEERYFNDQESSAALTLVGLCEVN